MGIADECLSYQYSHNEWIGSKRACSSSLLSREKSVMQNRLLLKAAWQIHPIHIYAALLYYLLLHCVYTYTISKFGFMGWMHNKAETDPKPDQQQHQITRSYKLSS